MTYNNEKVPANGSLLVTSDGAVSYSGSPLVDKNQVVTFDNKQGELQASSLGELLGMVGVTTGGTGVALTVRESQGLGGTVGNSLANINTLTFDQNTGFNVEETSEAGEAFIRLGSAFAPWFVKDEETLATRW
jgi:hypothetical protein